MLPPPTKKTLTTKLISGQQDCGLGKPLQTGLAFKVPARNSRDSGAVPGSSPHSLRDLGPQLCTSTSPLLTEANNTSHSWSCRYKLIYV